MARDFHRYAPAGLGYPRCGVCGGQSIDEVHIAGLAERIGGEIVQCPSCMRMVPADYTLRMWMKEGGFDAQGYPKSQQRRICRDCAEDPEASKAAAKRELGKKSKGDKIASLMGELDRGEITEDQYAEQLAELL